MQQDAFGVLAIFGDVAFVFGLLLCSLLLFAYSCFLDFAEPLFSGGFEPAESPLIPSRRYP